MLPHRASIGVSAVGVRALLIRFKIERSSKQYHNSINSHLEYVIGKFQKSPLSQNNLSAQSYNLFFSTAGTSLLFTARHVPNPSRHFLLIQSVCMLPPLFFTLATVLRTFACIDFRSEFFSVGTSLVARAVHAPHTTCNALITNQSLDFKGRRHVTASRAVAY